MFETGYLKLETGQSGKVFHGVENFFPQCGKLGRKFSMVWKKRAGIFHSVENFFPQCGKTSSRDSAIPSFHYSLLLFFISRRP
jgi:hypothetical protein